MSRFHLVLVAAALVLGGVYFALVLHGDSVLSERQHDRQGNGEVHSSPLLAPTPESSSDDSDDNAAPRAATETTTAPVDAIETRFTQPAIADPIGAVSDDKPKALSRQEKRAERQAQRRQRKRSQNPRTTTSKQAGNQAATKEKHTKVDGIAIASDPDDDEGPIAKPTKTNLTKVGKTPIAEGFDE